MSVKLLTSGKRKYSRPVIFRRENDCREFSSDGKKKLKAI